MCVCVCVCMQLPPRHEPLHVNILVVGQSGLGKTTFIQNMFEDHLSTDFRPHDGSATCMEGFIKDAETLCTHVNESVLSENEEYEIHYHVQDTPGEILPLSEC